MALDLLYYRVREVIAADNAANHLGDAVTISNQFASYSLRTKFDYGLDNLFASLLMTTTVVSLIQTLHCLQLQ